MKQGPVFYRSDLDPKILRLDQDKIVFFWIVSPFLILKN